MFSLASRHNTKPGNSNKFWHWGVSSKSQRLTKKREKLCRDVSSVALKIKNPDLQEHSCSASTLLSGLKYQRQEPPHWTEGCFDIHSQLLFLCLLWKNFFVPLTKMSPWDVFGKNPRKCQAPAIPTCWEQRVLGTWHSEALETGSALSCAHVSTT